MATGGHRSEGFILVEILVALGVVAVMGAMMAGVLGQMRSVNQSKAQILAQAELSAAAAHLQQMFASARRAPLPDNEDGTNYMMDGSGSGARFATVTRQGFYSLALRDVHIEVETAEGKRQLVETLTPRRPESESAAAAAGTLIVVLENVDGVSFEYSEDGKSYRSSFKEDGELPATVRITLSREVLGRTVSATVIARLM